MAETWRRAIQKFGSLGAISFEKAFSIGSRQTLQDAAFHASIEFFSPEAT
jgi:hypothetical protein